LFQPNPAIPFAFGPGDCQVAFSDDQLHDRITALPASDLLANGVAELE
jgi:hypothetical protein